jgi:hypothetical protein
MEERKQQLIINKLRRGMARLARSHLCMRVPPHTSDAQRKPEEAENEPDRPGKASCSRSSPSLRYRPR